MQQKAHQCGKEQNYQRIAADVWRRDSTGCTVCPVDEQGNFFSSRICYRIVWNIHLYFFRDCPRLENIDTDYSCGFPVPAVNRLAVLLHYQTVPVVLRWTCDVADKNGQKYIPVDCHTENGGVAKNSDMDKPRIFTISFASIYPMYIQKAERKGRTKAEVDAIIYWLTGYDEQTLQQQINNNCDLETFFGQAPQINPNASKITGTICGYRVEEIEDGLMQKIRYLDKLVDELAKGKAMDKITTNITI
jgi:hypothetical protein